MVTPGHNTCHDRLGGPDNNNDTDVISVLVSSVDTIYTVD